MAFFCLFGIKHIFLPISITDAALLTSLTILTGFFHKVSEKKQAHEIEEKLVEKMNIIESELREQKDMNKIISKRLDDMSQGVAQLKISNGFKNAVGK